MNQCYQSPHPASHEVRVPAVYDQHGIRFEFPENWEVQAAEDTAAQTAVTVTSPGTAFWSLSCFPAAVQPAEVISEVLAAMREEYPMLEDDATEEELFDQPMIGYDLNFFYLDLCNTARIRSFRRGDITYLILCQAEDHEIAQADPVFQAMTVSLLQAADAPEL